MKGFARNAICFLMTLILFCAVLGSGSMSVSVRAEELNNDQDVIQGEITDDVAGETTETVVEETPVIAKEEDTPEAAKEEVTLTAPRERMLDVCFFIRGNGIGAEIPKEPAIHLSGYSSAIRVNGAVSSLKYSQSTHEVDGSEEALLSDGFTASNEVSQMLAKLPEAEEIKSAVEGFDESKHYIVWYVIKTATTSYPNADVLIHVDGVIRERTEITDPETGDDVIVEPEEPIEVVDPIPDVTLEIRALFLENGVECKEIEFDGKEHIVGGFEIIVKDKNSGNPIIGYLYECYGKFLGTKSYADTGLGTEFTYQGQEFWVNVVKAFAKVTNPEDSQEVIFYDAQDKPLRTAADFIIKDSAGNILPAKFNVLPTTGTVSVKARDITIEAGTTVKNNSGQTLTDDSYEITSGSLLDGHRIERVVINGSQTGVGKSVNEISSINIVDEHGNSVNHLYNIKKVNGSLILVDAGGKETPVAGSGTETADGKDKSIISIVKTSNGMTVVTGNVTMDKLQSAGGAVSAAQVLGARRGDTSDPETTTGVRHLLLIVCFACAMFLLKNGKHTN